jgi:phospholipid/cholesterol/gamma-HCH transport system substrate-binding protein
MANPNVAQADVKVKVGVFTFVGLVLIGLLTLYVNDKPYWWNRCEYRTIQVEDATGLKSKSPVRSLGLDIGYIRDVRLSETSVELGICITAPVELIPETRAYIRSDGFLGDKFVELKPVRYIGENKKASWISPLKKFASAAALIVPTLVGISDAEAQVGIPDAEAQTNKSNDGKAIPIGEQQKDVQAIMNQVNSLLGELKGVTGNLKTAFDPEAIRATVNQLNVTLENASKTFAPEGNLSSTARRSLAKLEEAIEQMRDLMTRVNQGKGSVGMLLNDPEYAEEIRTAIQNLNKLLNKVHGIKLTANLGIEQLTAYDGSRASFHLKIQTRPERYYRVGLTTDPRGRIVSLTTYTGVPNTGTDVTVRSLQVEQGGFQFTAQVGWIFYHRYDFAIGLLSGDGSVSMGVGLGPIADEFRYEVRGDLYFRPAALSSKFDVVPDGRITGTIRPFSVFYMRAGLEGFRKRNDKVSLLFGGGIEFDDEDLKLLFSFL